MSEAREDLLAACVEYVRDSGAANFSLRQCAAAVGSSHRMLSYHFGSREGLLAAVVTRVAESERARLAGGIKLDGAKGEAVLRALWGRLANPIGQAQQGLFLELYSMALQHRVGDVTVLDGLLEEWTTPLADIAGRGGLTKAEARAEARLSLAVLRGLLLDLLGTGNRRAVNAALERYLTRLTY